jgi:DNA-binding transcriptional MocR family regulator
MSGIPEGKGLSPAFKNLVQTWNSASLPFALQAAENFPKSGIDVAAERMQHNHQMSKRFCQELTQGIGFSPEVVAWSFGQLTGVELVHKKATVGANVGTTISTGISIGLPRSNNNKIKQTEEFGLLADGVDPKVLFDGWSLPKKTDLQKAIEMASKDKSVSLLGGGLPPEKLIMEFFFNVFVPSLKNIIHITKKEVKEIINMLQYPAGGGVASHREAVIDFFLKPSESKVIKDNFTEERRAEGLFMTYGSQEALSMMIKTLVDQGDASTSDPVEIAITDPTYAGLLMAADEFLTRGVLKFRVIPFDEKTGQIDKKALDEALKSKRCKALYLAEGNPMPKKITNLDDVTEVLRKHNDKIVFDDHAYDGLGATEENTLFDRLPGQVVVFKTISKKASPFRAGFVYSNMTPEGFVNIRENMLRYHYNGTLGYSGILSGIVANILKYDAKTDVLKKHVKKAQDYYEEQRQLYKATYLEALNIFFDGADYDLDDEVIIGEDKFMFGWRNTKHVSANIYSEAGAEIKVISVSGTGCRPDSNYLASGEEYKDDKSDHRLRQNYTWPEKNKLQIGIFKDVLLELTFSDKTEEEKGRIAESLYKKMREFNKMKRILEVEQFIERMAKAHWKYTKKPD